MVGYGELVREAIKKAQQQAEEQRKKATVSEEYRGDLIETEYIKKNKS